MSAVEEVDDLLPEVLEQVRRFGAAEIDSLAIDAAHEVPQHVRDGMADLGLFGVTIPQEWGGIGMGLPSACHVVATLAEYDCSVATTLGLHLGLGTAGLVHLGSSDLKARYLPDLASGERLAAFAATEAGAGSDLAAIRTTAVAEGDELRLDGAKVFVTNGGWADVFTLLVSSPGLGGVARGQSLVLLERTDAGLVIGPEEQKLGLRGSSTTGISLESVRVPNGRVIGEPGTGQDHAHSVLARGRTVMAAGCVGHARRALHASLVQVTTRKQFRRPLVKLEVVRRQIAAMSTRLEVMGALVDWAAHRPNFLLGSLSAKVLCSEGAWQICDQAVQLHGGSGFIEETGLPLLLRDARITRIFEGANDVLLTHAGRALLLEDRADPGPPAIRGMWEAVAAIRDELVSRHGLRLLSRHADLHRLGRLAVLRTSLQAAVENLGETPQVNMWRSHVFQESVLLGTDAMADVDVDAIVEATLGGHPV
jgi:alkylation response protein AidB-like acyl-CoA dehydrogenase